MTFSERLAKARKERGTDPERGGREASCVLSGGQPVGEGGNSSGNR